MPHDIFAWYVWHPILAICRYRNLNLEFLFEWIYLGLSAGIQAHTHECINNMVHAWYTQHFTSHLSQAVYYTLYLCHHRVLKKRNFIEKFRSGVKVSIQKSVYADMHLFLNDWGDNTSKDRARLTLWKFNEIHIQILTVMTTCVCQWRLW